MDVATVGALVLATVSEKVSLAVPPLPSSVVTRTAMALAGVPLNVRVAASKLSQAATPIHR